MDIGVREKTIVELKGCSEKDIKYAIMEAMHHKDESILPSLGVLFEFVWRDANPIERKQIVKYIKNNI